jgi:tRNA threonylcarbamoyladenosine biosynthesis protein TsaE
MSEGLHFALADEAATEALGAELGRACRGGAVVYLHGDLGAGKTTLCRGVLRGLGFIGAVKSPTYTLVEPYELDGITVFHFDLYRLADPAELEYMGIRDYFAPENLCLIEWPEKGENLLPSADIVVNIQPVRDSRSALLRFVSARGELIANKLSAKNTSNISQL